jgi:hypothetical protein
LECSKSEIKEGLRSGSASKNETPVKYATAGLPQKVFKCEIYKKDLKQIICANRSNSI